MSSIRQADPDWYNLGPMRFSTAPELETLAATTTDELSQLESEAQDLELMLHNERDRIHWLAVEQPDTRRTLLRAREAIRRGDRAAGRKLLFQATQADLPPQLAEVALLWLSAVVDDPIKEKACLEQVVAINPGNEVAKRHLAKLATRPQVPTPPHG